MIGVKPANTAVDWRFPTAPYGEAKGVSVCFIVKPVGEPDAANPHVRFDERGWETGRALLLPRPSSTLLYSLCRLPWLAEINGDHDKAGEAVPMPVDFCSTRNGAPRFLPVTTPLTGAKVP